MDADISELGIKLLFLLIPGIVAFFLFQSIGPKRPKSDFESGLQIFVYGVLAYATVGIFISLNIWWHSAKNQSLDLLSLIQSKGLVLATADTADISKVPIIGATFAAVIISTIFAQLQNNSIPHRILRKLRLTNRTSEVDIWDFTMNSAEVDSWVTVRDNETGKTYQGWIRGHSDGGDDSELLLVEAKVYVDAAEDEDGLVEVDEIPVLYLGLDKQKTILELVATSPSPGLLRRFIVFIYGE